MLVTKRSTQLTAAAIVGILHHIERTQSHGDSGPVPRNIIAVDGGIFTQYHLYRNLVCEGVRQARISLVWRCANRESMVTSSHSRLQKCSSA